jgi:hypothetical protein
MIPLLTPLKSRCTVPLSMYGQLLIRECTKDGPLREEGVGVDLKNGGLCTNAENCLECSSKILSLFSHAPLLL